MNPDTLPQAPDLPALPRQIISIGAGAIVRGSHLPAYAKCGWQVACVYDKDPAKAQAVAKDFGIGRVATSMREAVATAPPGVIYDVAVPASAIPEVLAELPHKAHVLIQKPLGENLAQATAIRSLCKERGLAAAVNFQLRYAPNMIAARELVARGVLGDIHDVEIRVTCNTPWHLWTFLYGIPRMEIVYHSIHYVDLVRSFLGEPKGVWCKTARHPAMMELASTRTAIALDYGDVKRANISTNHGHVFGTRHQESWLKIEGTRGALVAGMGVNLDYPRGVPDSLEYCELGALGPGDWVGVPLGGSWFPDAFIGPMANLMRHASDETTTLATSVDDAWRTMAVVEACHSSSDAGATALPL